MAKLIKFKAPESRVESLGEDARQCISAENKMMSKLNTEGASIGSEHDAEFRLAYKGTSKAAELTPVNETPFGWSVQDMKNEVQSHNLFIKSYKQKEEKVNTETKNVHSPSVRDSTAKAGTIKFVYAKRRGERSSRTADNSSTLWTGVPMTDTAAANGGLAQTLVQATDVVDPKQGKANNADQSDPIILLGENLDLWDTNFDLSSAESSLASLYGESKRDLSIEFAVKLLMGETPLPKEAAEVEEFFSQKMNSAKSRK